MYYGWALWSRGRGFWTFPEDRLGGPFPLRTLQACRPCILWRYAQFARWTSCSQAFGMPPLCSLVRTAWLCNRKSLAHDKWGLLLVYFIQFNLVVPEEGDHEIIQLVTSHRVYKKVDTWERVAVLGACLVKVGGIHTYSLLAISFLTMTTLANHSG